MATWATRRKWTYLGFFIAVYFIAFGIIYFAYFYKPATCFDGERNGKEQGIDCGGNCVKLCPRQNIDPIVQWSRAFSIASSTYGLMAYIENPNLNAGAASVPYVFRVYDDKQQLLFERQGTTFIPVAKIFGVYEGPVVIASGTPRTVTFEFKNSAVWEKGERLDTILKATRIRLTQEKPYPRVDASLENISLKPLRNIEAIVVLYDDIGNAFAVSRTFVDSVPKESAQDIVFTWQKPFEGQFEVCEVPAQISLAIDRSGSMASDGSNPPEPLTSIKSAAQIFVETLGKNSAVSVVSFATDATVEQFLTTVSVDAKYALQSVEIVSGGVQQTNIKEALRVAGETLLENTEVTPPLTRRVIVLLTDGIPTEPTKSGEKEYPKISAEEQAQELIAQGIEIYAIGLGKNIDESFLQNIVSDPSFIYRAPTSNDVAAIYERIATSLCEKKPVIEVIPRIYPQ